MHIHIYIYIHIYIHVYFYLTYCKGRSCRCNTPLYDNPSSSTSTTVLPVVALAPDDEPFVCMLDTFAPPQHGDACVDIKWGYIHFAGKCEELEPCLQLPARELQARFKFLTLSSSMKISRFEINPCITM